MRVMFLAAPMSVALLASCGSEQAWPMPEGKARPASWQQAVELINSGNVESVVQAHDLTVDLGMKDGSRFRAVEPSIDEVWHEIKRCGEKCSKITTWTE